MRQQPDRYGLGARGRNEANLSPEPMRTELQPVNWSGPRCAGAAGRLTVCWLMRPAKLELSSLSDSNRNLAGYGLPALVTRSPGEG